MTRLLDYSDLTDVKLGKNKGFFLSKDTLVDAYDETISNSQFRRLGKVNKDYWLDNIGDNELIDLAHKLRKFDTNILQNRSQFTELSDQFIEKFSFDYLDAVPVNNRSGIAFKQKKQSSINLSTSNTVNLATETNSILTETSMVAAVYDQIYPRNSSPINTIFPQANYPTVAVRTVAFDPIRGQTPQSTWGQPFKRLEKRGYNFGIAKTRPFSEEIRFSPQESIGLRDPSSNSLNIRGFNLIFSKAMEQLPFRHNTAVVNDLYQAVLTGEAYYQGSPIINFGIPPANRFTGTQLAGGKWMSAPDSSGKVVPTTVDVLAGFRNLVVNTKLLSKYNAYEFQIFINPRTLAAIISNQSITPITLTGSSSSLSPTNNQTVGYNIAGGKVSSGEEMLISIWRTFAGISSNISVVVDHGQYIADNNDPLGNAFNSVNYLCPDGQMFIFIKGLEAGLGQYAYTPVPQLGGTMNPQAGVAYWMVDSLSSNTIDGTQNPFISYNINYSAIPLIFRNLDIFTVDLTS